MQKSLTWCPATLCYSLCNLNFFTETKDDESKDKLKFHWELVVGPLKGLQLTTTKWNRPLLKLTNVPAGEYQFKYEFVR